MTIKRPNWLDLLIKNYYLIVVCIYMLTFWRINIPTGLLSAVVMGVILFGMVVRHGITTRYSGISLSVMFYFLYCCVMMILSCMDGMSAGTVLRAASNSLLPIIFFWCGVKGYAISKKSFLLAVNLLCIIGIYLLIIKPQWFVNYCLNYGFSFTRLSSCVGSINIGFLSVAALIYSLTMCIETRGKKGKVLYLLSLSYVVASMQRSAWIVGILSLLIIHYYVFVRWHILKLRYIIFEVILILLAAYFFRENIIALFTRWMFEHEVSGGYGMISGRAGQWINGLKGSNLVFGSGFGSRGHRAMDYTEAAVADGGWIQLFCETGIIGMYFFLTAYCNSIRHGVRYMRQLIGPVAILCVVGLQAIGSNMFEFQIVLPLFWMSMGQIVYEKENKHPGEAKELKSMSREIKAIKIWK